MAYKPCTSKRDSSITAHRMARATEYFEPNTVINKQKLQYVQDVSTLALGIGAGILGLESLYGVLFFITGFSLCNYAFFVMCCRSQPSVFFKNSTREIFLDGVVPAAPGYIMMWCLVHALIN